MSTQVGGRVGIVAAASVSVRGFQWRGLGQALLDAGPIAAHPSLLLATSHPGTPSYEIGELPDDADGSTPKQRKIMSRSARLAAVAVHKALGDASWDDDRDDVGLFLGVGGAAGMLEELESMAVASSRQGALDIKLLGERGLLVANPLGTFHLQNNFTLCHSAIIERLRGPNAAFLSRGFGTVVALAQAVRALQAGECARALVGGADSLLHPIRWAEALREGWGRDPSTVPGEGAAVVALAADASPALGWIDVCSLHPAGSRSLDHALDQLDCSGVDLAVLAPAGEQARTSLLKFVRRAMPEAPCVDVTAAMGESQAATPALAWVAALDLLVARRAKRACILSVDVDGQLGFVTISSDPARLRTPNSRRQRGCAVVTGVGVVSAFGVGARTFFTGLTEGRSAVGPIRSFDASSFPVRVAGEVPVTSTDRDWMIAHGTESPLIEAWGADGTLRDRKTAFALVAASEAWRHAGCSESERDAWLCLALGLEQAWFEDFVSILRNGTFDWQAETTALPRVRVRSPLDLGARCVSRHLGLRGPTIVHGSACAAGSLSLAHAASLIEGGEASIVVCGGADSMVNPLAVGGFWGLGAPSPRASPDACRPFDVRRDGLVIGEGAAVFVVEREDRARARGVAPIARITGWASTQDAYRATMPRPDGAFAQRAMELALARAGLPASRIGWINAHGTGTPLNDPIEAKAIHGAFGKAAGDIPVTSIKGAVGHLMAAAGSIEAASCLLALSQGVLAGTAHHRKRDPQCELDVIGEQPRRVAVESVLSNSFGFGGQNATLIFERP